MLAEPSEARNSIVSYGVALLAGRFEGVDDAGHIDVCTPAERYTHESRAVAVAPAYRRRSLLMRYETQVRKWGSYYRRQ